MARTNETDVRSIIDTSLSSADVSSFIADANAIVNAKLSDADLSDDLLTRIEKWLTAHLISVSRERQAKTEQIQDGSVTYTGSFAKYLEQTSYGQMVLNIDTSNTLVSSNLKKAYVKSIKPDRK